MSSKTKWQRYSTQGALVGACNICGVEGQLTEDHVPPRGCPRVSAVRMHNLFQLLTDGNVKEHGRTAQNGVKYRSLCKTCNSHLLGQKYDHDLITLCNQVDLYLTHLEAGMQLPYRNSVRLRPQRLIRSIIGHMLASAVDRKPSGKFDKPLVTYFLDESMLLPSNVMIHYWLYPYKQQVLIRDMVYLSLAMHDKKRAYLLHGCQVFPNSIFDYRKTARLI